MCDFGSEPASSRSFAADGALAELVLGLGADGDKGVWRDHHATPLLQSVGAWAACEDCARLVDAGDKAGLARRAAERFGYPAVLIEALHALFWKHRRPKDDSRPRD